MCQIQLNTMDNSKFKILLVDDEPDIVEFLGYNLKKEGYTILTANNGKDAVEIAKKEIPHLIVLDVMMPDWMVLRLAESCANKKIYKMF